MAWRAVSWGKGVASDWYLQRIVVNDRGDFTEQIGIEGYVLSIRNSNCGKETVKMPTATPSRWTWNEAPFSTKLDIRRFFLGTTQEEALSRMHFLVDNRRRLGVLTGPAGCGKSMVLEVCAKQLRQQNRRVTKQSLIGLDGAEFLWRLAAGFGANPHVSATPLQLWRSIDDQITANRYQRVSSVLIFDDVEEAETEVLTALARLAQTDQSDDSRLTIILACDPSRTQLLGPRLQELCDLLVELEPWTESETAEFLQESLQAVACSRDLFADDAVKRLYELTEGVPRRVQQIAQLSLVAAVAQDLETVDSDTVSAVFDELSGQAVFD